MPIEQNASVAPEDRLFVARRAFKILSESIPLMRHYFTGLSEELLLRCVKQLSRTPITSNTVHLMGMGRSRLVAYVFADILLDMNLSSSVIGSTFAKPVRHGDVVIGISGSGETRSTVDNIRATTFREVIIFGITSRPRSQLARFSDYAIVFDWAAGERIQTNYIVNQLTGQRSSLTPMGTLFELSALLYAIGITKALYDPSDPLRIFLEVLDYLEKGMEKIFEGLKEGGYLFDNAVAFLEVLEKDLKYDNQVFWLGTELSEYVATMSAMRAQHAGIRVRPRSSWRFKKEYDHFLLITFDTGSDPTARWYAQEAANHKLRTNILTTNYKPMGDIDPISIMDLKIPPPKDQFIKEDMPYPRRLDDLAFQFLASNFLDSLIAQLAFDLGIPETEMKAKHANIE